MTAPAPLRSALLVGLVGLALGLAFQGSRGLYETTEGRYAEVAREMLEDGSWLRPTLDYRPHWTKPPLTYWAVAGGLALAGRNAWGVRLANGIALPLTALGVACLGWLLWGAAEGRLAGLVYASALFPVAAASTVSTDLLLSMWEVWAVAAWWGAVRAASDDSRRRLLFAFWFLLGLGFLTKGPPALLPLLPIAAWSGLAKRRGLPGGPVWSTPGFVAFCLVGLSWYLWAVLTTPGLLGYFLGEEVVARVASDRFGRNPEWWAPPLVYGPVLALGLGPWLAWRPRRVFGRLRETLRARPPEFVFLGLWLALPVVILSLSRSRLPLYVLPFFPVLALAFAYAQVRVGLTRGRITDPAGRWLALNMGFLLLLKAGAGFVSSPKNMEPLAAAVSAAQPARVILVDTGVLYGLQFYLDVPVERVSAERPSGTPARRGTLVVARDGGALDSFLASAPDGCDRHRVQLVDGFVGGSVQCRDDRTGLGDPSTEG